MTHFRVVSALIVTLSMTTGVARADVVLDWNGIMQSTVAGQNPFAQGRFAAITQLAVFEAVNAISPSFEPYGRAIAAPAGASADAAAVAAAYRVLITYFPGNAAALDAARANSLAAIPDGAAKTDGIAVGEEAAAAMTLLRTGDGSAPPQFYAPTSSEPGQWQRTPACPAAGGLLYHWRNVKPFGIASSTQFRADPPPALTSTEYAKDFNEVKTVGDAASAMRPQDRADVARFYNAVLAVATWNQAFRQAAAARNASLVENARAFALLNMAISDGLVTVMETKYHYTFWRPETAIANADSDGNDHTLGDAGFVPFLTTPCFPGYSSAHAAASYAAAEIARRVFGAGGHDITLTSAAVPGVTLWYGTFKRITDDIDDARVFGGIHFRFDQRAGARQGRDLGTYVYKHNLRAPEDEDRD